MECPLILRRLHNAKPKKAGVPPKDWAHRLDRLVIFPRNS